MITQNGLLSKLNAEICNHVTAFETSLDRGLKFEKQQFYATFATVSWNVALTGNLAANRSYFSHLLFYFRMIAKKEWQHLWKKGNQVFLINNGEPCKSIVYSSVFSFIRIWVFYLSIFLQHYFNNLFSAYLTWLSVSLVQHIMVLFLYYSVCLQINRCLIIFNAQIYSNSKELQFRHKKLTFHFLNWKKVFEVIKCFLNLFILIFKPITYGYYYFSLKLKYARSSLLYKSVFCYQGS